MYERQPKLLRFTRLEIKELEKKKKLEKKNKQPN